MSKTPTKTAAKQPTDSEAFPSPTKAEIIEARREGVKDAIQESTKEAYKTGADQGYGDSPTTGKQLQGSKEVAHIQHLVDLHPDVLADVLDGKDVPGRPALGLTEAQVAGLLEVERSGKNRTDIVQLLMKRLDIKHPSEVTAAGPAYTNDITRL